MTKLRGKEKLNRSSFLCGVVILLLCLLPRVILSLQAHPLRTRLDELATMGGAAYFAGLDWSGVMPLASYYGTGFTGLFAFIFKLTDDPLIIYRFYCCMGAVLQSLTGLICFRILQEFFHIKNKVFLILCSVMSSYMVVTRATIVYNEHMLIFLMWVITYLLLYINYYEDKKKKRIGTMILTCVLGYSLTVHARAIIFSIILVVVILGAYLYKKVKVVDIPVFAVICSAALLIAQCYVKWIQKTVWMPGEGEVLVNSGVSLPSATDMLGLLGEFDSWKSIFYTIIGQVNTISSITAGVAMLMLFATIGLLWSGRGRREKKDKYFTLILLVLVYCVGCIAITIAGQSITWLGGVRGILAAGPESDLYELKAFTYIRYFGPYCGPLVMMLGVLLYQLPSLLRKSILPTVLGMIVTQTLWITGIVPYMAYQDENRGSVESLLCLVGAGRKSTIDYAFFYRVAAVVAVLVLVIIILLRYNKKVMIVGVMAALLLYQYVYNAIKWDITGNQVLSYEMADSSYQMIQELEESMELPKEIYVAPNGTDFYEYQFMLNRYRIIPELPGQEATGDTVIVFARYKIEDLEGYTRFRLDNKEFMYVKGKELKKKVKQIVNEQSKEK